MDIFAMLLRIDELLKAKKMKKEDFYSLVPISDAAISQWRTGKTNPSSNKIKRMAELLDTTPEYLTMGIKKAPIGTTDKGDEFYCVFNQLNDENQSALLALAKTLLRGQE